MIEKKRRERERERVAERFGNLEGGPPAGAGAVGVPAPYYYLFLLLLLFSTSLDSLEPQPLLDVAPVHEIR